MPDSRSNQPAPTAPWAQKRDPSGGRGLRGLLPWAGVVLVLSAAAWGLWPKPTVVETGTVSRAPLTVYVSEEGKTRIRNRYVISAPVAGTMDRVLLKAGDIVKAGETRLTSISPSPAVLLDPRSRKQAEAAVASREAARNQCAESLTALKGALKLAEIERDRLRAVKQTGTVSTADRDRAEATAEIKAAEVRAAAFSLQVCEHELTQARAALDHPEPDGSKPPVAIHSPVSGRVLHVFQESHTPIQPGNPIMEIGDPADLEIEAEILSRDAVSIHPGDPASIEQWGGEHPLTARVRRVEPAAFTKISALGVEEQRVIVLCDLVNPPEHAKALGDRYRVEVKVAVWHSDETTVVPSGALFREGSLWKTFLYQDGKARAATVEVGHGDGRMSEVVSGLRPGDRVLVHPPDVVHDGSSVRSADE